MRGQVALRLTGVAETLVMPLWGRAAETARAGGLIRDPLTVEMIRAIDYDFSRLEGDWRLQLKIAIRTKLLDDAVRAFLERFPSAVVVNLGAGLCTRFARLDNGTARFFDLDLPEVIAVRRRFFVESERRSMIESSMFDPGWIERIPKGGPVLLVLEGVLPYFGEERVRGLLTRLAESFPGGEVLFEATTPHLVRKNQRDAKDRFASAKLHWGLIDGRTIEGWSERISFMDQWVFGDVAPERWLGLWRATTWAKPLKDRYHQRIVYARFR